MLRDALEFVFSKADESTNPRPHIIQTGRRKVLRVLNGKVDETEIERPSLIREVETLRDVMTLVATFKGSEPTIFVSEERIDVVLDNDDRLEKVSMRLQHSPQFVALLTLAEGRQQRELVRVLRTRLAGCVDNKDFLSIVRQVEFDVNRGSHGTVNHTGESLGRSVTMEARTKVGEIPEEIIVRLPLFQVPHDLATEMVLRCAVTVEPESQKISIEPTGNVLAVERKRVMSEVIELLESHNDADATIVSGRCEVSGLVTPA
ncbi:hypothetical protein [Roseiconus lacunae]|uniref:Flagellar motor switch protein FliM n=1 Tax=Roseiconus lacunae TaxID=2605694 RepID=A0ABT7PH48_9BACT|nr:hypothetical protein [Roseiconus lacunae]MDM4015812.1 hypothetical protein [Roseiconus lacunae]